MAKITTILLEAKARAKHCPPGGPRRRCHGRGPVRPNLRHRRHISRDSTGCDHDSRVRLDRHRGAHRNEGLARWHCRGVDVTATDFKAGVINPSLSFLDSRFSANVAKDAAIDEEALESRWMGWLDGDVCSSLPPSRAERRRPCHPADPNGSIVQSYSRPITHRSARSRSQAPRHREAHRRFISASCASAGFRPRPQDCARPSAGWLPSAKLR
jgi:hypothetical protein